MVIYPKNCPSQTYGYWLTSAKQQSTVGNHQSASGQLDNNSVNYAMLITIKGVITFGFNVINKRHTLFIVYTIL